MQVAVVLMALRRRDVARGPGAHGSQLLPGVALVSRRHLRPSRTELGDERLEVLEEGGEVSLTSLGELEVGYPETTDAGEVRESVEPDNLDGMPAGKAVVNQLGPLRCSGICRP